MNHLPKVVKYSPRRKAAISMARINNLRSPSRTHRIILTINRSTTVLVQRIEVLETGDDILDVRVGRVLGSADGLECGCSIGE